MRTTQLACAALAVTALCSTGAVRAADNNVVNIGYTGPLSGGAAQYGADVQHGVQMAIDEVNSTGGVSAGGKKYTLKLVSLDDEYRPNESAINAKRLLQQNNTPVIICPHSGGILALEGFNEKGSPKFLLDAYSSEPAILKQNDNLVLMVPPRYDSYFKPWVDAEMKHFGKKLGLMPTTTAYGNAWKTGFSDAWKAAGGTVGGDYAIDYNTTADFSGAVTKALTEKPDVMLVGGPSQPTALVMKAMRDQGFKGGFVMMDQSKFEQVDKVLPLARLDGTVGVVPVARYGGPGTAQFIAAYDKAFGKEREVNSEAAFNYMAMHAIARAMTLANSVSDPAAIAAKLDAAVKSLPKSQQVIATKGVSKAGHLELDVFSEMVDKGTFKRIDIPSLP